MNWYKTAQNFGDLIEEDDHDYILMGPIKEALGIPPEGPDPIVITEDDWFDKYQPIQNTATEEDRSWDGTYFETYGPEEEFISKANPKHVWTIMDDFGDIDMIIIPGMHRVNRFGYFITKVPWDNPQQVVVLG